MSATVRNAMLDAIEAAIRTSAKLMFFSGAVPVNCAAPTTGTKLLEFDLASDWAADASAGAKALSGLPRTVAAVAGGTLGYFRIFASDGSTCHMQGTSIATGGGDLTVMPTSSTRRTSPSPTHHYRAGA
jgi:hypothetical protein